MPDKNSTPAVAKNTQSTLALAQLKNARALLSRAMAGFLLPRGDLWGKNMAPPKLSSSESVLLHSCTQLHRVHTLNVISKSLSSQTAGMGAAGLDQCTLLCQRFGSKDN